MNTSLSCLSTMQASMLASLIRPLRTSRSTARPSVASARHAGRGAARFGGPRCPGFEHFPLGEPPRACAPPTSRSTWASVVSTPGVSAHADGLAVGQVPDSRRRRRRSVIQARATSSPAPAPVIDGRISSTGTPPTWAITSAGFSSRVARRRRPSGPPQRRSARRTRRGGSTTRRAGSAGSPRESPPTPLGVRAR
jgi:hypothetical protein